MTVVALPGNGYEIAVRRTALDLAILTSRRPDESPDDHAKGVPCWSEGVPYLQGSRPVIRSDSWPLEFAREFCPCRGRRRGAATGGWK